MAIKTSAKTPSSGYLRKAFTRSALAATLGVAVAYGLGSGDDVEADRPVNTGAVESNPICFSFKGFSLASGYRGAPEIQGQKPAFMPLADGSGFMEQWRNVLLRHEAEMKFDPAKAARFNAWVAQFDDIRDASISTKAFKVHTTANQKIYYDDDSVAFQKTEHWATPAETLAPRADGSMTADCEDFIGLKYFTLRALGVPAENMHILIVPSPGNIPNIMHVVLAVDETEPETTPLVATNDTGAIAPQSPLSAAPPAPLTQLSREQELPIPFIEIVKPAEKKPEPLEIYSSTGARKVPKPSDSAAPPHSGNYKIYYVMNENGFWRVAANSAPKWGEPRKRLPSCADEIKNLQKLSLVPRKAVP